MNAHQSRLLGIAVLAVTALVAARLVAYQESRERPVENVTDVLAKKAAADEAVARAKARYERGAYILRAKELSSSERLEVILLPEAHSEELETRCIVYKNTENRTSAIACTGVMYSQPEPPS
jgi:hypothetical protein